MNLLLTATALVTWAFAAPEWPGHGHYGPPPTYGAPTVTVKNGTVAGLHASTYDQDFFLGVPFAQPPVGELRFRNPVSINTTFDGTFQATGYAPECVAYGGDQIGYPVSEDCLYLNVIRPSDYEHQQLPVAVWIHGGGFYEGGTQDKRYNLSFIVENSVKIGKPIVAVSIGYRLNAWGFISSREVTGSGNTNIGLRDQRLALHWINENIQAFGGDATKVTIWGESAGAASVGYHLTAYNGRDDGLFRAGIMESGNPVPYNTYRDQDEYQPYYDSLVNATGCGHETDTLDCLRHVPYDVLNGYLNTTITASPRAFVPIVDGDFVQRWGSIQLAEGAFVKVPIIDGANTDEGTAFSPSPVSSDAQFESRIADYSGTAYLPPSWAPDVLTVYPANDPDYLIPPISEIGNYTLPASLGAEYRRSAAYFGDAVMIANRRGTCQAWAAHGLPAYSYRFNTVSAGLPSYIGVTHFTEVAFVFDNTQGLGYDAAHGTINPFHDKPQSYSDLAQLMSSSWASFVYDLDPNGFTGRHAGAPDWPRYQVDNPQNIVWDGNVTSLAEVEKDDFRSVGIAWIWEHAKVFRR